VFNADRLPHLATCSRLSFGWKYKNILCFICDITSRAPAAHRTYCGISVEWVQYIGRPFSSAEYEEDI
jgi:hypothetical protein